MRARYPTWTCLALLTAALAGCGGKDKPADAAAPAMAVTLAAAQEDVDVVGLSILSGAHLPICRRVIELLRENRMEGVKVFVGGIIPTQDIDELRRMGVAEVFLPGASTEDVAERIRSSVAAS